MKQFIAFILLISLLTPFFSKMMVYVDFKLHQNTIAETLCINKDLPGAELCYGNCYLATQLEKIDDQRQKQLPNHLRDKKEIVFVQDLVFEVNFQQNQLKTIQVFNPSQDVSFISSNYLHQVLQPPQV